jgi:beta-glucanase (GH16 family)
MARYVSTTVALALLVVMLPACGSPTAPSEAPRVLLRDDFNQATLDTGAWSVPTGPGSFIGRTQMRPSSALFDVSNGLLRLRLDTHNPTARIPGDSFWGSEIVSRQTFDRGAGLVFRARVRLASPVAGGMVASLFCYTTRADIRDEIDFEILTRDVINGRSTILTNLFEDDPFSVPGLPRFAAVPGSGLAEFNELEIDWMPDRVRWLVNGELVREETARIPDEPVTVRLNFWAPADTFADAFDSALQPAASPAQNRAFFYEVDFVEVRQANGPH